MMFGLEFLITVFTIVHAICFLNRPGISRDTIKLIVYRHFFCIIVNLLCQVYAIAGFALQMMDQEKFVTKNLNSELFWWIFGILFYGQGFFLALVRFAEPKFFKEIYNHAKKSCKGKHHHHHEPSDVIIEEIDNLIVSDQAESK